MKRKLNESESQEKKAESIIQYSMSAAIKQSTIAGIHATQWLGVLQDCRSSLPRFTDMLT